MARVLIVEGDGVLRDRYVKALSEDGYEILTACEYADALAQNLLHRPDIVIMDPGADRRGLEIALEIARVNDHVRVVFNTPDTYQYGRDFSTWVADAVAEKCADATNLRSALRSLAERRASA